MFDEYKQFHNLDVFGSQDPTITSRQEKYRALRAVNIIEEKRCGKIKGRMCAGGSYQCTYISWEEVTSSAIAPEELFESLLIGAHEGRAVQTFDNTGEYLHASIPDDKVVHMKSEGEFVDIMCEVNTEYKCFVTHERDKKLLYVQILNVIYGMIYI